MRVAINGLGRIGRAAFKILMDEPDLELVAANDLISLDNLAYLIRYDTVYGRYHRRISVEEGALVVDDKHRVQLFSERDPATLPWKELGIDLVFECTGVLKTEVDLKKHIAAGASFVILSSPPRGEEIGVVVHGVNRPDGTAQIISCASCTTNSIAPVVEVMQRRIGVERANMTTGHAYTASQSRVDGASSTGRRGGGAAATAAHARGRDGGSGDRVWVEQVANVATVRDALAGLQRADLGYRTLEFRGDVYDGEVGPLAQGAQLSAEPAPRHHRTT